MKTKFIQFIALVVVAYCVIALVDMTTSDASSKVWSCVFGDSAYSNYIVRAIDEEEAEQKFQDRFKEIRPYVFPSVKCYITKVGVFYVI